MERVLLWVQDGYDVIITGLFEIDIPENQIKNLIMAFREAEDAYHDDFDNLDTEFSFSDYCKHRGIPCTEITFTEIDAYTGEFI